MTKSLKQIQKENRKLILQAIHGCSYDEALKKELEFCCKVIDKKHRFFGVSSPEEMTLIYGDGVDGEESDPLYFLHLRGDPFLNFSNKDIFNKDRFEIIGKPITFDRVLLAIQFSNIEIECDRFVFKKLTISYSIYKIDKFDWNLTSETLEQQSEETQREINKILTII